MTSHIRCGRWSSSHWLSWGVLSLGCVSGCASWDQMAQTVARPWHATGELLARSSDRLENMTENLSQRPQTPATLPGQQLAQGGNPSSPTAPSNVLPANTTAPAPAPAKPLTPAPANVELLPAPPVSPTSATVTAPVTAQTAPPTMSAVTAAASAKTTWCRVRIRNSGTQPATQVAVTVSSLANATLVSQEGETISAPVTGKMEFAAVPQVNANEEVILLVGVATTDERANRLRVQVRDGQGGTNQELQARWKVTIEAVE
ncbi:MAG: hypothetical protein ACKV2Q_35935 [Planctomycetaceae bacterium]